MNLPMPYFMTNPDWYRFDEKKFRYELTEKAPEAAVKSYIDFYEKVDYQNFVSYTLED